MTKAITDYSSSWNEGVLFFFFTNLKTIKGESILKSDIYHKSTENLVWHKF